MDYLTLIPARKNSQRIKNKNLRKYNGISLIDKTIIDALKIRANNSIIVSSDDERILNRSKLYKGKNKFQNDRKKRFSLNKDRIKFCWQKMQCL
mgnify:CR=1 FL=1